MAFFAKFQRYYLSHFYMMIPLSIILLTCIGSIAVFLITQKRDVHKHFFDDVFVGHYRG